MKKDFSGYRAEDFIGDEDFQQWAKYPDKESNDFWNKFIAHHPSSAAEVRSALAFINSLQFNSPFPSAGQAELSLQRNLEKISQLGDSPAFSTKNIFKTLAFRTFATASLFAVAAFGIWLYSYQVPLMVQVTTKDNETRALLLPDSSLIILNARSSVSYPADLADRKNREVWLEGEAFFTVKHIVKNQYPNRFIVHAGKLEVEVLGTSFHVNKSSAFVNVALNSGKLKLTPGKPSAPPLYLNPGDFIQYQASQNHIVKSRVQAEWYPAWTGKKIMLDNLPMTVLIQLVADISGMKVKVADPDMTNKKISGSFIVKTDTIMVNSNGNVMNVTFTKENGVMVFRSNVKKKS